MFKTSTVINNLTVTGNDLLASLCITCPYNDGATPKAKIVFFQGDNMRRIPLTTSAIYRHGDDCTIVFNGEILLDSVFLNSCGDDITARFDFYYGGNSVEGLPFKIDKYALDSDEFKNIDKNYVLSERNDGLTCSDAILVPELEHHGGAPLYFIGFDFENSRLVFKKNHAAGDYNANSMFKKILNIPMGIIRFALAICLLPYFVLDGILAGLDLQRKRQVNSYSSSMRNIYLQIKENFSDFLKISLKRKDIVKIVSGILYSFCRIRYNKLCKKPIVKNRITFVSGRRDNLTGNLEFVYDKLKDNKDIDFQFLLFSDSNGHFKYKYIKRFYELYATSRVVVIDDYFRLTNTVKKRNETQLWQLWHACGAFKTFGYSRLGKIGGPLQTDINHRMYDRAIVSSAEIAKHYAEGFGISDKCVLPTGIPRTDVFLDKEYAEKIKSSFYAKHPKLKNKKIILFAPTFRGHGQKTAYYPMETFDPNRFYESIGDDYSIILKLHPFCKEHFEIDERYKDYIIDLSDDDELNDLLFVTNLLITDYSSAIFEASLLDIPMIFYAFDLYDYISNRDFYYDFENFVPGKIVFSENKLITAVKNRDFDYEKVGAFKTKFFDNLDGNSSKRVADEILKTVRGEI